MKKAELPRAAITLATFGSPAFLDFRIRDFPSLSHGRFGFIARTLARLPRSFTGAMAWLNTRFPTRPKCQLRGEPRLALW
jgi:hypothetical protein